MKIKCSICGTIEETYPYSPNHILKLCDIHLDWWREKKIKGDLEGLPLHLI